MNTQQEQEKNFWIGKRAKIEVVKDGKRLSYTATILEVDDKEITFSDREGIIYSFNRDLITEKRQLKGVGQNEAP